MRRAERPTAKTTTWERRDIDTMKMSPDNVSNTDAVVRQDRVRLSERVTLQPGDKVRVSGGPYWEQIGADGSVTKTRMGEQGVMVFEECCGLCQNEWVVARGGSAANGPDLCHPLPYGGDYHAYHDRCR